MRLIDGGALLDDFRKTIEECKKWEKDAKDSWTKTKAEHAQQNFIEAVLRVKAAPSVDAVLVVRCRDCKHCFVDGTNVRYNVCELNHNKVQSDNWFCADGERRE